MRSHLHFMGIGGISMSGLARHYRAAGHVVSGCDGQPSATLDELGTLGISAAIGHDPRHLDGVDVLVTSAAIADDAPERSAAQARGIPVRRRIDLLAEMFGRYRALGVTGTHGKSTTSGMIATVLLAESRDPAVQLGATLPALGGVMRYGEGPHLVAEVDESDAGFAQLVADVAVVTNLEDDHIAGDHGERRTYHASLDELEAAVVRYARQARVLVYCGDWPVLDALLADHPARVRYGEAADADYRIRELTLQPAGSRFVLEAPDGERAEVQLRVPGRYNALNATAALAATHRVGVPLASAASALGSFEGVGRRWQRWGEVGGALIIDDYAHHPTEVRATLEAARATGRRVRAVLQPHRWVRTARHWRALADAAALADEVVVLDVYGAGEQAIPGVSSAHIVARLHDAGCDATHLDLPAATRYLGGSLRPGDLVITLGAGDVWRVAQALITPAAVSAGTGGSP
ncbi:MAG: UDP-N-acetylmuramate--L-alanine ligase [Trueperaceae bacterium]|nr:UDP-N-acetylmuramate--L-alanine ligase [Trueperaceae bacterium]